MSGLDTLAAVRCPIINCDPAATSASQNENGHWQIPRVSRRRQELRPSYNFKLWQGPGPVRCLSFAAWSRTAGPEQRYSHHDSRIRRILARSRIEEKFHCPQAGRSSFFLQVLRAGRPLAGKPRQAGTDSQIAQAYSLRALGRRDERLSEPIGGYWPRLQQQQSAQSASTGRANGFSGRTCQIGRRRAAAPARPCFARVRSMPPGSA